MHFLQKTFVIIKAAHTRFTIKVIKLSKQYIELQSIEWKEYIGTLETFISIHNWKYNI